MFDLEKTVLDCSKNKRKAQLSLYNQYSAMLLGVCQRYATDKSEAEDILQEAFLKILKNISDFKGKGQFENWMKKIVINTAITNFHKEKKHYYHDEIEDIKDFELQDTISPDKEFEIKELYELLKTMPEGYRMIFNLYAIEGYKHKEIAEKLKIDESTSKTQYLRAKNWLIREMKKLNWL
ncbi:MAG: sigma-70 family RNA polymerase sigma factor [Bacteroidales bacterium]|nr:sigma-70 family RNA polymerase sigma factor [Bacteroidales bacterium]MBN2818633.1 sigma-70 family RNA polymerase sigma factor [Bacteroidales bacterium]